MAKLEEKLIEDVNADEKKLNTKVVEAYSDAEDPEMEGKFAQAVVEQINKGLEARERQSYVFNNLTFSDNYVYNQRKAINYSPPRNPDDDREVSMGLIHEKIIGFAAFFLREVYKRRVKCYDDGGNLVRGMGEIYDLAIEHSYRLEDFKKLVALIYWETFSQGFAGVLEEWEVRTVPEYKSFYVENGEKVYVNPDTMDYTYEFLEKLQHEEDGDVQHRRARSRLLDGRSIIFADPEIEDEQDQPWLAIEQEFSHEDAQALYGTLERWDAVPSELENIKTMIGEEKTTLFDSTRLDNPKNKKLLHIWLSKETNRMNLFLNGVMLLPRNTPMSLFHPRMNYPLSLVKGERLTGSIYPRSTPAKTKFNDDFVNWALKMLAQKFEQGVVPPILAKGNYTLTRKMFRGGQVTHGVSRDDFEKADPENKGVTNQEFSFVGMLKDIVESQTLNSTTTGEVSEQATATAISQAQSNQIEKLGYLLDGIVNGFRSMAMRRAETIESKYTIKQKETLVDGKRINVYQNFTVSAGGVDSQVVFDDTIGNEDYPTEDKAGELFERSFQDKKQGFSTRYYLANPTALRQRKYTVDIEIVPERVKDTQLQLIQFFDEMGKVIGLFPNANREEMQEEYLKVTGRPSNLFLPTDQLQENVQPEGYNTGSFGRPIDPTIKSAARQEVNQ